MKIAIIASGFLPVIDGVTVSGFYRLQKLSQWGYQVRLFCPDYSSLGHLYPNWRDYTGDILPGIKVVNLKSTPFFVEFERNVAWNAYGKLLEELNQFQPDIIHVDEPERIFVGFWRVAGVKYARKAGIPCVCFLRTNFLEYLEDFFPLPAPLFTTLQFLFKKMLRYVYNAYDATFVSSPITQQKIIQLGINNTLYANFLGFEQDKFDPNLRQPNFFAQKYGLAEADRQVKLIFLGRLTPDKGWNFTLKALPQIYTKVATEKIAILVAGDGEIREEIATKLSQFTPHVHLLGRVPPEEVPALLANSDIHVTTSTKETRGLTVLEAFAAGIPVLAPRAGGVVENIEEGVNGFLFTPHDQQDFISKLILLVNDPALRQQMGVKGRKLIIDIDRYSWDRTVKNLVQAWEGQIAKKQAKAK